VNRLRVAVPRRRPRVLRRRAFPGFGWVAGVQLPKLAFLAVLGPGLVSGFADNDAGGITTYSVVGAQFGYALLWVVLASMLALFVTQEVGARLGLVTGRGLLDLIREGFGIRWAALGIVTMLVANLGTTLAEFAGIGAALSLFGVPVPVSVVVAVLVVGVLLARAGFMRIQFVFLAVGAGVSVAYLVSAVLAHPDWGKAGEYLVAPHGQVTSAYLLAVVGTVGRRSRLGGRRSSSRTALTSGSRRNTSGRRGSTSLWARS
jgi:NRAMP (natural resistance-associated macrophage protein)-like metal ion transporter